MTTDEIKETAEYKVSNLAGEVWNAFLKVDGLSNNDVQTVNEAIHRIQDMMLSNLFTKIHGKL